MKARARKPKSFHLSTKEHNSHNSGIIKRVIKQCEISKGLERNKWFKRTKKLPTFNLPYRHRNSEINVTV